MGMVKEDTRGLQKFLIIFNHYITYYHDRGGLVDLTSKKVSLTFQCKNFIFLRRLLKRHRNDVGGYFLNGFARIGNYALTSR